MVLAVDGGDLVVRGFIVDEPHRRIALTTMDVPHQDCVEWAARIRTFLGSSGWIPSDERAPVSSAL